MTTPYHIKISPPAQKQILNLESKQQRIIIKLIEALAINPRPPGVKKIEGMKDLYCDYINHHRLIYKVEEQDVLVLVIK